MDLRLRRDSYSEVATLGRLYQGDEQICHTCEDRVRAPQVKVLGRTAIPPGRYPVVITYSQRFGRPLPLLQDVPGFAGVRIHPGNGPEDTAGCVLVGCDRGPAYVVRSREAYRIVEARIRAALGRGEEVWLTVEQDGVPRHLLAPDPEVSP